MAAEAAGGNDEEGGARSDVAAGTAVEPVPTVEPLVDASPSTLNAAVQLESASEVPALSDAVAVLSDPTPAVCPASAAGDPKSVHAAAEGSSATPLVLAGVELALAGAHTAAGVEGDTPEAASGAPRDTGILGTKSYSTEIELGRAGWIASLSSSRSMMWMTLER
jgi:hypothetical protein